MFKYCSFTGNPTRLLLGARRAGSPAVLVEDLLLGLAEEVLEALDERRVLLVVLLLEVHLQLDDVVQVGHADGAEEALPHLARHCSGTLALTHSQSKGASMYDFRIGLGPRGVMEKRTK